MLTITQSAVNEYTPFEYPEVQEYVPEVLPSHEFKTFSPPLTHKDGDKYYARISHQCGYYIGPFLSRAMARTAALHALK